MKMLAFEISPRADAVIDVVQKIEQSRFLSFVVGIICYTLAVLLTIAIVAMVACVALVMFFLIATTHGWI